MTSSHTLLPEMSPELQLANSESLRLFCEGVQALETYDRNTTKSSLDLAIDRLGECVLKYPQDLLPRFYLGVAKSLTSYPGLNEALDHFRVIEASNVSALRLVTKFNRATTLIAFYQDERFEEAKALLGQVLSEIGRQVAYERDQMKPLLYRAWAESLFIRVRQTIWVRRKELSGTTQQVEGCRSDFDEFERQLKLAQSFAGYDDVWAFHYNNEGLYEESMAYLYNSDSAQIQKHARAAEMLYQKALKRKTGWPAALANLARVYYELLNRKDEAMAICQGLTHGVEQVEYAHYLLGIAYLSLDNLGAAIKHLEQAPHIPEAAEELTRRRAQGGTTTQTPL